MRKLEKTIPIPENLRSYRTMRKVAEFLRQEGCKFKSDSSLTYIFSECSRIFTFKDRGLHLNFCTGADP